MTTCANCLRLLAAIDAAQVTLHAATAKGATPFQPTRRFLTFEAARSLMANAPSRHELYRSTTPGLWGITYTQSAVDNVTAEALIALPEVGVVGPDLYQYIGGRAQAGETE